MAMPTLPDTTHHPKRLIHRAWFQIVLLVMGVQLWFVVGKGMYGNTIQWRTALIAVAITCIPPIRRRIERAIDKLNGTRRRFPSPLPLVPEGERVRVRGKTSPNSETSLSTASRSPLTPALSPEYRGERVKIADIFIAILIWIGSCCVLYGQAVSQHRYFYPKAHDEFAYLVQMQMIARGHLWYPKHPLTDFFDSFQIIIDPVYCSMYFPGQAMLYVPSVWFHLPPWVLPLIVSGACAMMAYVVFARLFDRVCGIASALLLVSIAEFRRVSIELFAHLPSLLFGLLMVWAYLRWKESSKKSSWAILIGVFAGWSAITRPLDALMYAIPVGVAMLVQMWFELPDSRSRKRQFFNTLAFVVIGAIPLLSIQMIFNRAVSGSVFTTPFNVYANRDFPMTSYGFHDFDAAKRPQSILPQKQAYHDDMTIKLVKEHTLAGAIDRLWKGMLPATLTYNLPQELLIILMPAGLFAVLGFTPALLRTRRGEGWGEGQPPGLRQDPQHVERSHLTPALSPAYRGEGVARVVLLLVWPLFLILYFFYTFFLSRYVVPVAPAVILLVIGAVTTLPGWRVPILAFIMSIAITSLPSVNRSISDELFEPSELIDIQKKLDAIPGKAIVLFRWDPSANYQAEPVYNTDVAWPDDARVIRAHDLGDRNFELYRYYANQNPSRTVYRLDRKDNSLTSLGTVGELATH